MNLKLDHINITVRDISESANWYKEVFGMKVVEGEKAMDGKVWAIVAKDDSMICMTEKADRKEALEWAMNPHHNINHFGIRITDEDKWLDIVKKNNLKLYYGGVNHYPDSKSWYIKDPNGHSIEVSISNNNTLRFPKMTEAEIAYILIR